MNIGLTFFSFFGFFVVLFFVRFFEAVGPIDDSHIPCFVV